MAGGDAGEPHVVNRRRGGGTVRGAHGGCARLGRRRCGVHGAARLTVRPAGCGGSGRGAGRSARRNGRLARRVRRARCVRRVRRVRRQDRSDLGLVPLREALEIDLPHLAPVDEERLQVHQPRRAVQTQPELAAECVRLDAVEDVIVHDAGALARSRENAEVGGDRVGAQRVDERPREQADDGGQHRQPRDRGHAAPHAVRTARYRQPIPSSASPVASAA